MDAAANNQQTNLLQLNSAQKRTPSSSLCAEFLLSAGEVIWRTLKNPEGVMTAGSFSSPILANVADKRQLLVQTREKLTGVDPAIGQVG